MRGSPRPKHTNKKWRQNNYYPFGLQHQGYNDIANSCRNEEAEAYKYLNKEYVDSFALNVTETDFRHYDSALGRFNVMDALSELAYNHTPYRYGYNNPIFWSDPTGLYELDANGNISVSDPYEIGLLFNYLNHNSNTSYKSIAEFMSNEENGFSLDLPEMIMTMKGGKITGGGAAIHSNVQKALNLISNFNGRVNVLGVDVSKFAFDFFGAEQSNLKAASAMAGHAGLHLSKTESLLKYVGATEGVLTSAKS
ncbi:RHS repeat-associated core domain-containing protein [Myroides sp. JBRI-B21084]|uniref:RHS repeat-associated core domain-containing protein n=1 Tax=Myroides sp. JBRI-B21084 TaxID=3119977 RepID=UPI0026E357EB|nr:RHS repeat-associated core domain-containing protein [Paenimyroides cloacae]WKW46709.1 RHS repeat-associated core domain-containing protein [Paenimyroides cloacae]